MSSPGHVSLGDEATVEQLFPLERCVLAADRIEHELLQIGAPITSSRPTCERISSMDELRRMLTELPTELAPGTTLELEPDHVLVTFPSRRTQKI